jgi:hypothetical protein
MLSAVTLKIAKPTERIILPFGGLCIGLPNRVEIFRCAKSRAQNTRNAGADSTRDIKQNLM